MARSKLIATQDKKFRLAVPTSDGRVVVVFDDPELVEDPDYAEGVNDDLQKSWEERDYFLVELWDADSKTVDAVGSMAGYGGPRDAALAAMNDYFGVKPAGKTGTEAVASRPSSALSKAKLQARLRRQGIVGQKLVSDGFVSWRDNIYFVAQHGSDARGHAMIKQLTKHGHVKVVSAEYPLGEFETERGGRLGYQRDKLIAELTLMAETKADNE